jgi:hypothetical protein
VGIRPVNLGSSSYSSAASAPTTKVRENRKDFARNHWPENMGRQTMLEDWFDKKHLQDDEVLTGKVGRMERDASSMAGSLTLTIRRRPTRAHRFFEYPSARAFSNCYW